MIKLSRLDGEPFVLNADLIRYVERRPDTFITLTSGERIVVRESLDEVVDRAVRYQQHKHLMPSPQVMLRPEIGMSAADMPSTTSACPTS